MNNSVRSSRRVNLRPLTKSEQTLLILLAIVVIVYLSNRFILTRQEAKISNLETEIADLNNKIADMNNTIKNEAKIKKEWEMMNRERDEVLKNYFPVLDQAQMIYLLNDLIKDDKVVISDLGFSNPAEEIMGDMAIKKMDIKIPYNGTYEGTIEVMKALSSSPRRIVVDSLTMNRENDSDLTGNMLLKIYSLEGLADTDPEVIPVEVPEGPGEGSLFASYEGYVESGGAIGSRPGGGSTAIDERDYSKVFMLHDFEVRNYSFVPSNENVKGNVEPSTIKKSGKYSLRFEYNIFAIGKENRAYIDLGTDIIFNYPPKNISTWVNAFGYSSGTLGLRFRTQDGQNIDVEMSKGISWLGWSEVEAVPPQEVNLYPLKLTHIYFEMPYNRDDIGVFIIDKLQAFYPVNQDSAANNQPIYDFYVVKPGDTIFDISRKIYGSVAYVNEIMNNNSLTAGDILPVGKVLVLVRR